MITVERGKDTTKIELAGDVGTLMLETISLLKALRNVIDDKVDNPEQVMFHFVDDLIDAAWGNL